MIKHTVTYVDYNGEETSDDLYFHLTVPEVTRMQIEIGMDVQDYIDNIIKEQDMESMFNFFENILLSSYGIRSEDGKRFIKSPKVREDFEYSQAYAELFTQVLTQPDLAKKLAEGMVEGNTTKIPEELRTRKNKD